METESEGHLPFLDLDIYRRPDGSLDHKVYRKPTHTNLCLNAKSHHHPSNKQAVLSTLIHRATALCDKYSLQAELVFLKDVFKKMATTTGRSTEPSTAVHIYLNRITSPTQSPSYPFSVHYSTV
jgi:hypothetical protein